MNALKSTWICLALMTPSMALGQAVPAASAAADFSRLWTGWGGVNREAMSTETDAVRRVRHDVATADARRLDQLRNQGRALGERVGEIVRLGDCAEGERVARAAGDFALVEAVRAHCAAADARGE
jgi:hypothetical protein